MEERNPLILGMKILKRYWLFRVLTVRIVMPYRHSAVSECRRRFFRMTIPRMISTIFRFVLFKILDSYVITFPAGRNAAAGSSFCCWKPSADVRPDYVSAWWSYVTTATIITMEPESRYIVQVCLLTKAEPIVNQLAMLGRLSVRPRKDAWLYRVPLVVVFLTCCPHLFLIYCVLCWSLATGSVTDGAIYSCVQQLEHDSCMTHRKLKWGFTSNVFFFFLFFLFPFDTGVCGRAVARVRGAVDRGPQGHDGRRDGLLHRRQVAATSARRVLWVGRSRGKCRRPGV